MYNVPPAEFQKIWTGPIGERAQRRQGRVPETGQAFDGWALTESRDRAAAPRRHVAEHVPISTWLLALYPRAPRGSGVARPQWTFHKRMREWVGVSS